jgi:hypothetical protein
MNHIRRLHPIRRAAGALAVLAVVLLAATAAVPAAFALPVPPIGGGTGPALAPPEVRTVVVGGMPGWQIALIAAGAAAAAAAVAVILDRARATRQHQAAPSA